MKNKISERKTIGGKTTAWCTRVERIRTIFVDADRINVGCAVRSSTEQEEELSIFNRRLEAKGGTLPLSYSPNRSPSTAIDCLTTKKLIAVICRRRFRDFETSPRRNRFESS